MGAIWLSVDSHSRVERLVLHWSSMYGHPAPCMTDGVMRSRGVKIPNIHPCGSFHLCLFSQGRALVRNLVWVVVDIFHLHLSRSFSSSSLALFPPPFQFDTCPALSKGHRVACIGIVSACFRIHRNTSLGSRIVSRHRPGIRQSHTQSPRSIHYFSARQITTLTSLSILWYARSSARTRRDRKSLV